MRMRLLTGFMLFLAATASSAPKSGGVIYPNTKKVPVVEHYAGTTFRDDYRWLENAADPAVKKWVAEENHLTRSVLDAIPARASIARSLDTLYKSPRLTYAGVQVRGGRLFATKSAPPQEQSTLVVFDSWSDRATERVLFDPNTVSGNGSTSIDFYVPSLDGKLVAISESQNGSEDGSLHVYEVDSGRELGDVIPRVNFSTAGGSVAWNREGSGFWYTRYPQGDERTGEDINFYQQVWFHRLGTARSSDVYAMGKELPRIAEITLETSDDGNHVLATVANGDGGEFAHWLRMPDGRWVQITRFADRIPEARFGGDGAIYLLSHEGASNGRVLRVQPDDSRLTREVVIAEGRESIDDFVAGRTTIYVARMAGGPSVLEAYSLKGAPLSRVSIPPISAIYELVRVGGDDILLRDGSYTEPPRWFRYDAGSHAMQPTVLTTSVAADFSDAVVVREMAISKDGTRVPVNIIYRKGTKIDGTSPTLLSGYGGYSISQRPGVSLANRLWLDGGGIIAVANLRGGAEFGEAWHEAGKMLQKQNVFDDFAACARHLISRKYTNAAKLAIQGGSNGGLLVGVMMTQHPDLFRAAVSRAGFYDVPRWLETANGVFNIPELGSPHDPQQLRSMLAYSPYHHVAGGVRYPALLMLSGDNDGRVDPMHSRKFTARLQEATSSTRPILLRTNSASGHGFGTALSETIAALTDTYAFLWKELRMKPLD